MNRIQRLLAWWHDYTSLDESNFRTWMAGLAIGGNQTPIQMVQATDTLAVGRRTVVVLPNFRLVQLYYAGGTFDPETKAASATFYTHRLGRRGGLAIKATIRPDDNMDFAFTEAVISQGRRILAVYTEGRWIHEMQAAGTDDARHFPHLSDGQRHGNGAGM